MTKKKKGPGILEMKVSGVHHLIERAYRESGEQQYIRELVINSIEAGAKRIEISPEWATAEHQGVYRLMVADDGKGMTKEELLKFLCTFGGGGKPIGEAHENFGVGAKTSLLPWNHQGVVVMSWTKGDPDGAMVHLMKDPVTGEYGARTFETDEQGFQEIVAPYGEWTEVKPPWIKDHGTVVVCLGNTGKEDTFLGKDGTGDIKGISSYINKRLWEIPKGVTVTVHEFRSSKKEEWPRSLDEVTDDKRYNRRSICGARHYLVHQGSNGKLAHRGEVSLRDGTVIEWFLWAGERPQIHSFARKDGYIAALYKNELYDVQQHPAHFRMFGITTRSVRETLTLVAKPPMMQGSYGVYPDTARNALKIMTPIRAGEPLPWAHWGAEFSEKMPEEIKQAIAKSQAENQGTIQDEKWRERLIDRFGSRWKSVRFFRDKNGDATANFNEGPGHFMGAKGKKRGPAEVEENPQGFILQREESEQPVAAKNPEPSRIRAKSGIVQGGLPIYRWTADLEDGIAAVWAPVDPSAPNGVVLLSRTFAPFIEVKSFWKDQFAPHLSDEVDRIVEDVYGEALVAKIAHSQELTKNPRWSGAKVDAELRSPAALTMASLGLFSEDAIISARVSGTLGARKKSA